MYAKWETTLFHVQHKCLELGKFLINIQVYIKECYFYHPASLCIAQTHQVFEDTSSVLFTNEIILDSNIQSRYQKITNTTQPEAVYDHILLHG